MSSRSSTLPNLNNHTSGDLSQTQLCWTGAPLRLWWGAKEEGLNNPKWMAMVYTFCCASLSAAVSLLCLASLVWSSSDLSLLAKCCVEHFPPNFFARLEDVLFAIRVQKSNSSHGHGSGLKCDLAVKRHAAGGRGIPYMSKRNHWTSSVQGSGMEGHGMDGQR